MSMSRQWMLIAIVGGSALLVEASAAFAVRGLGCNDDGSVGSLLLFVGLVLTTATLVLLVKISKSSSWPPGFAEDNGATTRLLAGILATAFVAAFAMAAFPVLEVALRNPCS